MAVLDKNNQELAADDEFVIRGRVLETLELGELQILRVEWLTGPTPMLNYVRAATVEKVESE